ncbi:MAG: SirB2 family protein [Gammaproteobacteria bacterium]|nr:regulator SirB [Rhodocyclaceae bacterium]MBU3910387.1 SirB2 family protein [Gammaproteobacteria bacterium]MBU3988606.1 SirB2 family protein [Gammaproteobacteria bacterium]MBU4004868.1 SirB2 family protein [Gammaproteobacteria bacterium]MBU4020461.1 SirB2 family protein [Gammaproteobacteria bacterium]
MLYVAVKHLHVACVILSITGFCLRGLLVWQNAVSAQANVSEANVNQRSGGRSQKSALMGRRWMRSLPHINDSILLAAALTLTALIGQYPFVDAWLTAKVLGLIAYIILGAVALRPGQTPRVRATAGFAAVVLFGWIVSVALTKNPLGLFA